MYDFVLILAASVVASVFSSSSQQPLPRLNIDPDAVTVSGFSSGGVLAPQFHLAYSANVSGAASWAGKPYLVRVGGCREEERPTFCLENFDVRQ